jgi:hypothetical protein
MPLRGQAAVVIWSDMADPIAHDLWHSREHLPERVGIPGFLRARRCATIDSTAPRYFVLYELKDATILTSPEYLARLNNPTPWTAKTMQSVRSLSRTLCRAPASFGDGVGANLLTIRLAPRPGRARQAGTRITDELLSELSQAPGLTGAHLLQREQAIERPDTVERQLRVRPDDFIDWVILLEGYAAKALSKAAEQIMSSVFADPNADGSDFAQYQLQHVMCAEDLPNS